MLLKMLENRLTAISDKKQHEFHQKQFSKRNFQRRTFMWFGAVQGVEVRGLWRDKNL